MMQQKESVAGLFVPGVPRSVISKFETIAEYEDRSRSAEIRRALSEYVDRKYATVVGAEHQTA